MLEVDRDQRRSRNWGAQDEDNKLFFDQLDDGLDADKFSLNTITSLRDSFNLFTGLTVANKDGWGVQIDDSSVQMKNNRSRGCGGYPNEYLGARFQQSWIRIGNADIYIVVNGLNFSD